MFPSATSWFPRFAAVLALLLLPACGTSSEDLLEDIQLDTTSFKDYWYQGKAEITRFKLKQNRYGEQHEGDAVQIFVTEPFLEREQIKHEYGQGDSYSALKLNFHKNFLTGLYPYSIMTSVFSRVDFEQKDTAKVTFSSQDWCGQVYAQLNHRDGAWQFLSHSYFQAEGDQNMTLPTAWIEDEIWNRIRTAPNDLPVGDKVPMMASMEYYRLRHKNVEVLDAKAELKEYRDRRFASKEVYVYSLTYQKPEPRKLSIYFDKEAPYTIYGWVEQIGEDPETLAVRTHSIMSDYWSKNNPDDIKLRKDLGLK